MSTTLPNTTMTPELLALDSYDNTRLTNVGVCFTIISTVIFLVFNTSRLLYAERNGWEIWTTYPLSYVLSIGLCLSSILFVRLGGTGRHLAYWIEHDPAAIETFLKLQTATEYIYIAGVTFPKVSILVLYLRIFVERKARIFAYITLGIVVVNFIVSGIIVTSSICQPFAYNWDKTILDGHCADVFAFYRYMSIPNILTDLAILILPLTALCRLQMNPIRKAGICFTFATGSMYVLSSTIYMLTYDTKIPTQSKLSVE